jgi:glycosyltransferase involved in cell wall biosynthesis
MKTCFITEDFYPCIIGGQGIYGKNLVENLTKNKVLVTVLAENKSGRKQYWENKKNVKLILVPFCFGNQLLLAFFEYLYFILYERKNYYDIVHANQLSGFFFAVIKPKNVGKIVISVHNTNYDMSLETKSFIKRFFYQPLIFLEKIMYQLADGLIFNSPDEENIFKKYFGIERVASKSVYLGPASSASLRIRRGEVRDKIRKELDLPEEAKIVLYVGRIVKRKKVETLVRAMCELYNSYKSYKYYKDYNPIAVIIGQGSDLNRLKAMASPNVKFLGFVENTKDYFLAADLFALTSVAEGGFSLSVLEAASYGLPLIVSPSVAGFPIIKEGKNGYIVNPDDVNNLTKKILLTLKNQEKFSKESLRLSKNFSWEKTTSETLKFYSDVSSP